jgi:hypothetical protein
MKKRCAFVFEGMGVMGIMGVMGDFMGCQDKWKENPAGGCDTQDFFVILSPICEINGLEL